MKTVEIGIADDSPYVRWCDADICDIDTSDEVRYLDDWLNERGRWTRFNVPPTERLAVHIARLYNATTSMPAYKNVMPDTDSGPIPLVYVEAFICQPKGFEYDWVQILRWVQRATDDIDLELFIDAANELRGKAEVVIEQKAKTSKSHAEGNETKALQKPNANHKLTGYDHAVINFGGKPEHGDTDALIMFWKLTVTKTDDARLFDADPVYEDIEPIPWDVSWKTARNQIGKLLKERLSRK